MAQQKARITIHAAAIVGALVSITSKHGSPVPLQNDHDAVFNLQPGDKVTIEIQSDERWLSAQAESAKAVESFEGVTDRLPVSEGADGADTEHVGRGRKPRA